MPRTKRTAKLQETVAVCKPESDQSSPEIVEIKGENIKITRRKRKVTRQQGDIQDGEETNKLSRKIDKKDGVKTKRTAAGRKTTKSELISAKKSETVPIKEDSGEENGSVKKKTAGKQKTKVSKDQKKKKTEESPKKARTQSALSVPHINLASHKCSKFVGAHVSIAGGLHNAVDAAIFHGAKAFGLFLKSQRQWNAKPLLDKDAQKFKDAYQTNGFSPGFILPHGSYLMNCGSPNPETLQKSRDTLVDELQRCEQLGLTLYNFHPGSSCGEITTENTLGLIAESINIAHTKTKFVVTVIENMSCQGNTVGGKFQELKAIIDAVKDQSRIGVCLDTCHAFAAGYDLSTELGFESMMAEFDSVVGFKYLKAVHLNDSKGAVGCHLDRHENIGRGHIGIEGFRRVMCDPRFNNVPMLLETPADSHMDIYRHEIELLHSMCKM